MKILVCSKLSIPAANRTIPDWQPLKDLGHNVAVEHPSRIRNPPDVIISMGVTVMEETFEAIRKFPSALLFCYNWDTYEWVWTNPREGEYDYKEYGTLLIQADEVWVPSNCTGKRTTQWWGITTWRMIKSSCPYWEHDNIRDDGYALCCLREIPDKHWGMFEKCCKELGIPYRMTKHECTYKTYQNGVAGCRFIVAPLYELSTGGLSLMEAYYHGKPVLINDSKWNGAKDYFGDRAAYFDGTENGLKMMLQLWHNNPPTVSPDHKEYITTNFSDQQMCLDMLERIEAHV